MTRSSTRHRMETLCGEAPAPGAVCQGVPGATGGGAVRLREFSGSKLRRAMGSGVLGLVGCLVLAGCVVSPPVQEMSNARQAISAARAAGAMRFAPTRLMAAQRWLETARYALQIREYGYAERAARTARQRALASLHAALRREQALASRYRSGNSASGGGPAGLPGPRRR